MTATPENTPVPRDLLYELLSHLDAEGSLAPLFEGVVANFKGVAQSFGFLLDDNLLDVGPSTEGDVRVFRSSATMREEGLGRHISLFWDLRMPLEPARFGSSSLCLALCESGEPNDDVRFVLGQATSTWWADMSRGWTPEHAKALADHFLEQWKQVDATHSHRLALQRLEAILAI